MAARGRRFSFLRFMSNAFPTFANDCPNDVNLSIESADALVAHQLQQSNPRLLTKESFFFASVTDNLPYSRKVHRSLQKAGIIPVDGASMLRPGRTVDTTLITRRLPHQVAVISIHAQRRLIGMLFFWEEECVRWDVLDTEKRDIEAAAKAGGDASELAIKAEAVRIKKMLVPSERGEPTVNVGEGVVEYLPCYE